MKIEKIRKHCEWIIDHFKEINYFDEFTNNEELVYSSAFVLSQIGKLARRLDQEKKKITHDLVSGRFGLSFLPSFTLYFSC